MTADAKGAAPAGGLTFHAIDTWSGATLRPLRVDIARLEGGAWRIVRSVETADKGRSDGAWLEGAQFPAGRYELSLRVDEYFRALDAALPTPAFLSCVPIRFGVAAPGERHHVVVLFGPWSYAYYRGS